MGSASVSPYPWIARDTWRLCRGAFFGFCFAVQGTAVAAASALPVTATAATLQMPKGPIRQRQPNQAPVVQPNAQGQSYAPWAGVAAAVLLGLVNLGLNIRNANRTTRLARTTTRVSQRVAWLESYRRDVVLELNRLSTIAAKIAIVKKSSNSKTQVKDLQKELVTTHNSLSAVLRAMSNDKTVDGDGWHVDLDERYDACLAHCNTLLNSDTDTERFDRAKKNVQVEVDKLAQAITGKLMRCVQQAQSELDSL